MQDDILLGILTVRETFNVAAQLRLPPSVTAEQKSDIVDAIINVRHRLYTQGSNDFNCSAFDCSIFHTWGSALLAAVSCERLRW